MKIYPHLWFQSQAEEAAGFYTSVFQDSKALARTELPDPELSVVRFELAGLEVAALNARSHARYSEAFSFVVENRGSSGDRRLLECTYGRRRKGAAMRLVDR